MRLTLDDDTKKVVVVDDSGVRREFDFYTPEAFHYLSAMWVKMGWGLKYIYTFTWMGRPIIQLPDDMFRVQEVIYSLKPDVIVETGIAHGGSLIFYASLCKTIGKGRVIGVDIEIRPHNREAIEKHPLFPYITLIEGNAVSEDTFERVRAECGGGGRKPSWSCWIPATQKTMWQRNWSCILLWFQRAPILWQRMV